MNTNLKWLLGAVFALVTAAVSVVVYVESVRSDASTAKREGDARQVKIDSLVSERAATQRELGELRVQVVGLSEGQKRIESNQIESTKRLEEKLDRLIERSPK